MAGLTVIHVHTVEVRTQYTMNIIMIGYVINVENIFNGGMEMIYRLLFV